MVSRLVLGGGAVGQRVVEAAAQWPGRLSVVTDDPDRVETLRGAGVTVTAGEPAAPAVLDGHDGPVDVVLVAATDPDHTLAVLAAVEETFPATTVLAYAGTEATDDDRRAIADRADRVVDATELLASAVLDRVESPAAVRARRLRHTLLTTPEPLAVLAHDNPDPDAIASAVALARIAESVGVEAVPCHYGRINHQENRAMVNLLEIDLRKLDAEGGSELREFGGFALVDHSRPGVNDQLPADLDVDVVVDHHPPRSPVAARFVDLRSDVGATSTLMTSYLERFDVPDHGGRAVATALLYGIRVDTREFTREVSSVDFEAAAALLADADTDALDRVESPDASPETFDTLAAAIRNRETTGRRLASCVGAIRDRDALAQAADRLLDMEHVDTTFVYGYDERTVYGSARARGTQLDLGETLRVAFDDAGSAGGHADMAGAQIPLSGLGEDLPELSGEELERAVRARVSGTFFAAVRDHPMEVPTDLSVDDEGSATRYVPSDAEDSPD